MEVIGGKEAFETEVVQHGYRFKLDFSKVGLGGGLSGGVEGLVWGVRGGFALYHGCGNREEKMLCNLAVSAY